MVYLIFNIDSQKKITDIKLGIAEGRKRGKGRVKQDGGTEERKEGKKEQQNCSTCNQTLQTGSIFSLFLTSSL